MSLIIGGHRLPIIILVATALHFIWAAGLMIDPSANHATAIHALLLLTEDTHAVALILCAVALAGLAGVIVEPHYHAVRVLLMLPQQCILIMSSVSASSAIAASMFADGIVRPRWFIVVDQVPIVLITIGYMLAVTRITREPHG